MIFADIHGVCHPEIMKRAQQFFFQRFRQPDLRGKPVVKIRCHIAAVHPLRRGRQPQQDLRLKMIKQGTIAGRRAMVGFIHHNVIVK